MSLAEPTTTLTDYALAVVSTAFSVRLFLGVGGSGQTCHWLWDFWRRPRRPLPGEPSTGSSRYLRTRRLRRFGT